MTLRLLASDEVVGRSSDAPVVCILVDHAHDLAADTIRAVSRYTSAHVPILVAGASGADVASIAGLLSAEDPQAREVLALERALGAGVSAAVDTAREVSGAGDIVLIACGVSVGPGWLEALTRAAHCDSTVVSATALNDGEGPLGVGVSQSGGASRPLEQPDAALAVTAGSPRAYPRIPSAGFSCAYLRRELFERLGGMHAADADPAEALSELSRRASQLGMLHVAADDVFVTLAPAAGGTRPASQTVEWDDDRSVLQRSLVCARAALYGISVTIDARSLGSGTGGTQLYTTELILALTAEKRLRVRVVVPPDLPSELTQRFAREPALETITYEQAVAGVERSDVVHRPQQVFSEDDLRLLHMLGERVVIGQQDLIAYRNPAYHPTIDRWQAYRRVTRLALAVADRVVFFSEHAKCDAVDEDLVAEQRGDVVGIGADLLSRARVVTPRRPEAVPEDRELLICVGADYKHKNRPFAIELLRELRLRHDWAGCLVLAGPHVQHGSSREEEATLLAEHPELTGSVIDLGPVDESEKAWLYARARAVVYPTLYEGFGLIPFEAARAGVPCLYAPQAALVELAGPEGTTLTPWDAQLSSDTVATLLRDGIERERHLSILRGRMARSTWSDLVGRLVHTYEEAVSAPFRAAAPRGWQDLQRERLIVELAENAAANNRAYNELMASVGTGLPLVAEGGLLSRDEQRGLMRVASRRSLHSLILGPLGALGRVRGAETPASDGSAGESDGGVQPGDYLEGDDVSAHW